MPSLQALAPEVVDGGVAVLEAVSIIVASTSVAVVKVELVLKVVVDIVAPVLEGVDVTVADLEVVNVEVTSTSVAVITGTRS